MTDDPGRHPLLAEYWALPLEKYLQELGESADLPVFAIGLCAIRYEQAGPVFRKILERAAAGEYLDGNEALLFFRGLHITGGRRDTLAFKPLLRFLRRPRSEVEDLLGDATTETLPQIVAGVFDGDVAALFDAALDLAIEESVRDALIGAASFLTWDGRIPLPPFVEFLQRFDIERLAPDGDMAWFGWMNAIAHLGLRDMQPAVMAAAARGALPKELWEPDYFEKDLVAAEQAPKDAARFKEAYLGYIDDVMVALERFHTGDDDEFLSPAVIGRLPEPDNGPAVNPWRHVGRNDPCPCGSGKKAKRCCMLN
ncbi:MAG TPA: DUF1186 domain-containing protein [Reyranella sp.]|jgi:hypothetical protein